MSIRSRRALQIVCPTCEAPAGETCKVLGLPLFLEWRAQQLNTESVRPASRVHIARIERAAALEVAGSEQEEETLP